MGREADVLALPMPAGPAIHCQMNPVADSVISDRVTFCTMCWCRAGTPVLAKKWRLGTRHWGWACSNICLKGLQSTMLKGSRCWAITLARSPLRERTRRSPGWKGVVRSKASESDTWRRMAVQDTDEEGAVKVEVWLPVPVPLLEGAGGMTCWEQMKLWQGLLYPAHLWWWRCYHHHASSGHTPASG